MKKLFITLVALFAFCLLSVNANTFAKVNLNNAVNTIQTAQPELQLLGAQNAYENNLTSSTTNTISANGVQNFTYKYLFQENNVQYRLLCSTTNQSVSLAATFVTQVNVTNALVNKDANYYLFDNSAGVQNTAKFFKLDYSQKSNTNIAALQEDTYNPTAYIQANSC